MSVGQHQLVYLTSKVKASTVIMKCCNTSQQKKQILQSLCVRQWKREKGKVDID